ncbi:MAG: ABC transporter ATP-binding protein, partial [Alphaproteobacteria bacterium]|nr:ABC transporter ATP-binding protein [Alphaproteobacteria bacterium]
MDFSSSSASLIRLRKRPLRFLLHYVGRHAAGHAVVLGSVFCAVVFAVSTQYGVKHLIDVVSHGPAGGGAAVWGAFAILCGLIAA